MWTGLLVLLLTPWVRTTSGQEDAKAMVKIVVHDRIRGFLNWLQPWFVEAARNQCSTRCVLTEDKGQMRSADIVVYHAPTHAMVSQKPNDHAIRLFISMEQPKYAKFLQRTDYLEKNFDLISTYSMSSTYPGTRVPNLPITYFPLNILSPEAVLQPSRPFQEKNGYGTDVAVAMFVSNSKAAGASERAKYCEELIKFIPIHSYGKVLNNRQEPDMPDDPRWPVIAQKRARKVKVLSHYKFYLAFENFQVPDYVSEKIYEGLFAGAVPVYRGARDVGRFMPSNDSYIDANDMSPRELADLLKRLSSDEGEYNRYFAFKDRALPKSFEDVALMSYTHPNILCRLCTYALEKKQA
jgi:hypothetical protein